MLPKRVLGTSLADEIAALKRIADFDLLELNIATEVEFRDKYVRYVLFTCPSKDTTYSTKVERGQLFCNSSSLLITRFGPNRKIYSCRFIHSGTAASLFVDVSDSWYRSVCYIMVTQTTPLIYT
jgi:hypothetical protein